MTERAIHDAYRAMGPRPGAEAKIWQQIDRALDGRAAERRIELRPRRRSAMILRTAAVLVLALGLLAAAGILALPRLIGAWVEESYTASPAETAQPIPTLAPEDLTGQTPAEEPDWTLTYAQPLEQSYRYLALQMIPRRPTARIPWTHWAMRPWSSPTAAVRPCCWRPWRGSGGRCWRCTWRRTARRRSGHRGRRARSSACWRAGSCSALPRRAPAASTAGLRGSRC